MYCQWLPAQRKIHFITSLWKEFLKELSAEWAPGVSDMGCLCCQSKAERWLRLISILMNANWHICYGGLAVQTLQLAWLINYPPAGGSLEMEAGEQCGEEAQRWKSIRKNEQEKVQKPSCLDLIFYLITLNIEGSYTYIKNIQKVQT